METAKKVFKTVTFICMAIGGIGAIGNGAMQVVDNTNELKKLRSESNGSNSETIEEA